MWWVAVVAVAGAVPTLLWTLHGGGFIHDDWSIASGVEFAGAWETIVSRSTGSPARPLSALYYGVTYGVFGTEVVPHLLLLALLNAVSAGLVLLVGRRLVGPRVAMWTALAWVALPNRGSTRLWLAMGPAVLAVCLLLVGILLVLGDRPLAAGVVMATGVLAYEGIAALALTVLMLRTLRSPRSGFRRAGAATVPVVMAGAFIYLMSPKREGEQAPFSNIANLLPAQVGTGLFGPAARVGGLVVLVTLVVALARLLPSFRAGMAERDRTVLAGLGVLVLGAAPFSVAGFPFSTDGIFDRGNLVAGLGTALILGALLTSMATTGGGAGLVLAAATVGYLAAFNSVDLRDYRQAVREGESLQADLARYVPKFDLPLVVGPPLPNRGGVSQFIAYDDLGAALRLTRDDPALVARIAITAADFDTASEPLRYDRLERRLIKRS